MENSHTNIKAIIFDLDNTLLDRTSTFLAFAHSFAARYFEHLDSHQEIIALIVELDEDGYKDKRILFQELLEQLSWLNKPDHEELMIFYKEEYVKSAVLMDGALEVINQFRNRYKIALITNGRNTIQYGKIDRLGIREQFHSIIVSEEAGCKKPDSRIFNSMLTQLDVSPEQCIYVGDHPVNDIEGASQVGMSTVWMKVNQPWRDELTAKPLYQINQISELLKIF